MPNTYTQLHVHFVFAVKYRASLIDNAWKHRMHEYITGIIQRNNHKMLQINSEADHIHMLVGLGTHQSISTLIKNVKTESTKWIRRQDLSLNFNWQEGYGAFSYAKSQLPIVIRYIQNQEIHHRQQTFLDEYRHILNAFEVAWDEKYIFAELQ